MDINECINKLNNLNINNIDNIDIRDNIDSINYNTNNKIIISFYIQRLIDILLMDFDNPLYFYNKIYKLYDDVNNCIYNESYECKYIKNIIYMLKIYLKFNDIKFITYNPSIKDDMDLLINIHKELIHFSNTHINNIITENVFFNYGVTFNRVLKVQYTINFIIVCVLYNYHINRIGCLSSFDLNIRLLFSKYIDCDMLLNNKNEYIIL